MDGMHDMTKPGHGTMPPGPMHNMDMMKMYFHTGVDETVLFHFWKITTAGAMVGACIGVFILAALYEGLKVLREHLQRHFGVQARFTAYAYPQSPTSQNSQETIVMETRRLTKRKCCSWPHLLQSILHVVQVVISYFLMLIFMTYNVWLCLAVVLGAGAGYLAFGWHKAIIVDMNEHCH